MSNLFLLTSVPPRGAKTGRQEKVNYRVNKLIENGYNVTVVVPNLQFSDSSVSVDEGVVKYYGLKLKKFRNDNEGGSSYMDKAMSKLSEYEIVDDIPLSRYQPWYLPPTIRLLHDLCSSEDILMTQSYPFVNNLIGCSMKILFPDLLWIMEYRDPWLTNPNHFPDGGSLLDKYLEQKCVETCDSLVYYRGSQIKKGYFTKNYRIKSEKIHRIRSWGFNERHINNSDSVKRSEFTIVHAGSFWEEGTEIENFIKGAEQFICSNEIDPEDFKLVFLGSRPSDYTHKNSHVNIYEYMDWLGWQDHQTAIEHIKGADYGLYIQRVLNGDQLNISTKMFDYIGASTPVLCLSREGWQSWEFVNEYDIGITASIDDPDDIQSSLETAFYSNDPSIDQDVRDKFRRKNDFDTWMSILNSDPV